MRGSQSKSVSLTGAPVRFIRYAPRRAMAQPSVHPTAAFAYAGTVDDVRDHARLNITRSFGETSSSRNAQSRAHAGSVTVARLRGLYEGLGFRFHSERNVGHHRVARHERAVRWDR